MRNLIRIAVMLVAVIGVQPTSSWATTFKVGNINIQPIITTAGQTFQPGVTFDFSPAIVGSQAFTLDGFVFSLDLDISNDFSQTSFINNDVTELSNCSFAKCWSVGVNYIASQKQGAVFVGGPAPSPATIGSPSIELIFDTAGGGISFGSFFRNSCPEADCALPTPVTNKQQFGTIVPLPAPLLLLAGGIAVFAMFSRLRRPVLAAS